MQQNGALKSLRNFAQFDEVCSHTITQTPVMFFSDLILSPLSRKCSLSIATIVMRMLFIIVLEISQFGSIDIGQFPQV
jgi:hypothetical protein